MAIDVPTCSACGLMTFPPHLRCSRCGSAEWTSTPVERGVLEARTVIERTLVEAARGVAIGSVRIDDGPWLIARLMGDPEIGSEVLLSADGAAVVASPAAQ